MENGTKMSFKKTNGKTIVKNIPKNLVSLYLMQGWEIVKEKVEPKATFSSRANREEE